MENTRKLFWALMLCFLALSVQAQKKTSAGDKLFTIAQSYQQTMTEDAQKKAISYYLKAKKAFDSTPRKDDCDRGIKTCQNTIKALKSQPKPKPKTGGDSPKVVTRHDKEKDKLETIEVDTTELSLSASTLEFKSKSESNTITVNCNRNDWKAKTSENWITFTRNGDNITVIVSKNDSGEDRTGKLTVSCGKVTAELLVQQKSKVTIGKIGKSIGGFFKKTKKKSEETDAKQ